MFSGTAQFSHQVCQFCVSFVRSGKDLCLSMNARFASILLIRETSSALRDAIVVSAGKLRKLWNSLSELHSSVCVCERLERTVLRPALLPVKTAQFNQFFRRV